MNKIQMFSHTILLFVYVASSNSLYAKNEIKADTIYLDSDLELSPDLADRYENLNNLTDILSGRYKRDVTNLIIEMAIFTDREFYDYVRERYSKESENKIEDIIRNVILAVINSVEMYLNHQSLGQKIKINIVQMFVGDESLQSFGDIRKYLDNFCTFQSQKKKKLNAHWDHALLLTGQDLYSAPNMDRGSSGMAYLMGMCSPGHSCTISEARSLGSASLIISHELAHNLGVEHDGERSNRDCNEDDFIMSPVLSAGAIKWSKCSKRQIQKFINSYGDCLQNSEAKTKENYQNLNHHDGRLPGVRFDGNDQCHLMYGSGWTLYSQGVVNQESVNICKAIWCRKHYNLRSPNAAALQGTECKQGRHCDSGLCVAKTRSSSSSSGSASTPSPSSSTSKTKIYTEKMSVCQFFRIFGINYPNCNP